MPQKLPTSPRSRGNAQALFLREKSLRSKNPSLISISAAASADTRRSSEYARQLREKQKVRRIYGVPEGQFKRYYKSAGRSSGNTAERLLQILELRLDNVIYRAGFAVTRAHARQLVSHGWFKVNDQKVNIPSFQVSVDQKIVVSKKTDRFEDQPFDTIPGWLEVNKKQLSVVIKALPTREDIDPDINEQLIIEFYSR